MTYAHSRRLLRALRLTFFHPQWFAYRRERARYIEVGKVCRGRTLDIGCASQVLRRYIVSSCEYVSTDSPKIGAALYAANPKVFADAHNLPFASAVFDTIVMMELAEHLIDPALALREAARVLRPDGTVILTTPFLYPIHDAPYDYRRWTAYGLKGLANGAGFQVRDIHAYGSPIETGALAACIALALHTLECARRRRLYFVFLFPLSLVLIPLINLLAWLISAIGTTHDNPMPVGYTMKLSLPARGAVSQTPNVLRCDADAA